VFTLSTPGDLNYDPNDAKLTEEYASMCKNVDDILNTTLIILLRLEKLLIPIDITH
jgi:hypothetical protein